MTTRFHKHQDYTNISKTLSRFGQKVPLIYLMSGEFPHHMNLIHSVEPVGLHRVFYELCCSIEDYLDIPLEEDDACWRKVVRRVSPKGQYHMIR